MTTRFKADGAAQIAAVWTGEDDAPFWDPLGNFPRIKMHSALDYIGIAAEYTGTIDVADLWVPEITFNLAAHGLPYTPIVFLSITAAGVVLPVLGTMPLRRPDNGNGSVFSLSAGADATNVLLHCYVLKSQNQPNSEMIAWRALVANMGIDASGNMVRPGFTDITEMTPSRVRIGRFDTDQRYLNQDDLGSFAVPVGPTMNFGLGLVPNEARYRAGWRYAVDGHVVQFPTDPNNPPTSPGTDSSFNAVVEKVAP